MVLQLCSYVTTYKTVVKNEPKMKPMLRPKILNRDLISILALPEMESYSSQNHEPPNHH